MRLLVGVFLFNVIFQKCSWAYEDPDLDRRNDFDGPPIEVTITTATMCFLPVTLILKQMRSKRRMRARHFGQNIENVDGDPAHEVAACCCLLLLAAAACLLAAAVIAAAAAAACFCCCCCRSFIADADDDVYSFQVSNENEAGVADMAPTEHTDGHIVLREKLVKQFEVRYKRDEVHWLHYPELKKKSKSAAQHLAALRAATGAAAAAR